jgi:Fic family protein
MEQLNPTLQMEATLRLLTLEVIRSAELEGEIIDAGDVRAALTQSIGFKKNADKNTPGVLDGRMEMILDATQRFAAPMTEQRLFGWHSLLFPDKKPAWRANPVTTPHQVVHYQAPHSYTVPGEMAAFLEWFNTTGNLDPFMAAAIAHLWFLTIHPFEDGNGRLVRAISALQLARADDSPLRFYSLSAQLCKERVAYYDMLEKTQAGSLDITAWLEWFLHCLDRAVLDSGAQLSGLLAKSRFWERNTGASLNDRQRTMLNRLLDGFEVKLTSSIWARLTASSPDTAIRDINDLLKQGILVKDHAGGRSTSYRLMH